MTRARKAFSVKVPFRSPSIRSIECSSTSSRNPPNSNISFLSNDIVAPLSDGSKTEEKLQLDRSTFSNCAGKLPNTKQTGELWIRFRVERRYLTTRPVRAYKIF